MSPVTAICRPLDTRTSSSQKFALAAFASRTKILSTADDANDAYLRVRVKTEGPVPGIAERIREVLPNAVVVELDYERAHHDRPEGGVRTLHPRDQFVHYYRHAHEADPAPDLMEAFDHLYTEAAEGSG